MMELEVATAKAHFLPIWLLWYQATCKGRTMKQTVNYSNNALQQIPIS